MNRHSLDKAISQWTHADAEWRRWLAAGGNERLNRLAAAFMRDPRTQREPRFAIERTPNSTPYRAFKGFAP